MGIRLAEVVAVVCWLLVAAVSVTPPLVVGVMVVGVFLTEKDLDLAPQSFKVNSMVKFSPAGREDVRITEFHLYEVDTQN